MQKHQKHYVMKGMNAGKWRLPEMWHVQLAVLVMLHAYRGVPCVLLDSHAEMLKLRVMLRVVLREWRLHVSMPKLAGMLFVLVVPELATKDDFTGI
jgi:hypothetical protein